MTQPKRVYIERDDFLDLFEYARAGHQLLEDIHKHLLENSEELDQLSQEDREEAVADLENELALLRKDGLRFCFYEDTGTPIVFDFSKFMLAGDFAVDDGLLQ